MKLWIIDEFGLRTEEGKELIRRMDIKEIEIPDEILADFKTAYELWLEQQTNKIKFTGGK